MRIIAKEDQEHAQNSELESEATNWNEGVGRKNGRALA